MTNNENQVQNNRNQLDALLTQAIQLAEKLHEDEPTALEEVLYSVVRVMRARNTEDIEIGLVLDAVSYDLSNMHL